MKKLLFAAMAAAMASMASAATDQWTFDNAVQSGTLKAGYKAGTSGGTSTEFLGSDFSVYYISVSLEDGAYDAGKEGERKAKIASVAGGVLDALRSGKTAAQAAASVSESVLASSTTAGSGLVNVQSGVGVNKDLYYKTETSGYYQQTKLAVLSVVMDEDNIYLAFNNGDANNKVYNIACLSSEKYIDATGEAKYSSDGWYAIPEPTSGLLLLIGMAGLALKRKRD